MSSATSAESTLEKRGLSLRLVLRVFMFWYGSVPGQSWRRVARHCVVLQICHQVQEVPGHPRRGVARHFVKCLSVLNCATCNSATLEKGGLVLFSCSLYLVL